MVDVPVVGILRIRQHFVMVIVAILVLSIDADWRWYCNAVLDGHGSTDCTNCETDYQLGVQSCQDSCAGLIIDLQ
jgi:hypothetical protein